MGLRREPPGGWPLDRLFVGVATLRTTRELFRQSQELHWEPLRAWDISLWSGVTPKGSTDSMNRLARLHLVTVVTPGTRGRPQRAPEFALDETHPLVAPLNAIFAAERSLVRRRHILKRPRA